MSTDNRTFAERRRAMDRRSSAAASAISSCLSMPESVPAHAMARAGAPSREAMATATVTDGDSVALIDLLRLALARTATPDKAVAADLGVSPQTVSKKLNPQAGHTNRFNLDDLGRIAPPAIDEFARLLCERQGIAVLRPDRTRLATRALRDACVSLLDALEDAR